MVKMKVVMDDEKLKSQGVYEVMHANLDKIFRSYGITKTEEYIYSGGEDISYLGVVHNLEMCGWFLPFAKEWVWIDLGKDCVIDLLT